MGRGDVNRAAGFAKELLVSQPEVILSNTTPVTAALHRETKKVPLVFVIVSTESAASWLRASGTDSFRRSGIIVGQVAGVAEGDQGTAFPVSP